jgi:hypothetical protein
MHCVFANLGFPRGPWSSNIFTDHKSWWSWTYTHQGSSCHSSWSWLESKVPEHRHILIRCIPFGFIECLSLQVFYSITQSSFFSTDNQSVDRVYRIGQTKNVIAYRLMTCATVEEKIYKMQV